MYPQSMFRAKIRKISTFLSENYYFYSREKLQYITRACLRNDTFRHASEIMQMICVFVLRMHKGLVSFNLIYAIDCFQI